MKLDLDQSTIQVTQGNLISLPDEEGSTVAVLWGKVWLTQDGDRRDYELNAGESFTIRGDGLILISALKNARLTILQPCEDVAISSMKPSEKASRATVHGKANDRDGVLYLSGDELQQYMRSAHELRAEYIASLIASLGSALSRGLTKLGNYAVALWLNNTRRPWTDQRNRWYLS